MAVDEMKNGVPPDDKEFAKDMQQLASSYLSPDSQTKVTVSDELRDSLTKMISGEKEATKTEVTVTSSLFEYTAWSYESIRSYEITLRRKTSYAITYHCTLYYFRFLTLWWRRRMKL